MVINEYDSNTGWAQVDHDGRLFTVRITDFENIDAVKAFILEEDEKLQLKPVEKFTPVIGVEL